MQNMQATTRLPLPDAELLALLQNPATQERGFRELMHQYQERLYWHVRRMVLAHDDANDIMQNTLIRAYRSIDKFKGDSKIYTWLYRIATNECITFLNKKKQFYTHYCCKTAFFCLNTEGSSESAEKHIKYLRIAKPSPTHSVFSPIPKLNA